MAIESISSINITHGALARAAANNWRTRLEPVPTNISSKSLPDAWKYGTPASPATLFAFISIKIIY